MEGILTGTGKINRCRRDEEDIVIIRQVLVYKDFEKGIRQVYMLIPRVTGQSFSMYKIRRLMNTAASNPSFGIGYIILTSIVGTGAAILIGVPIGLLTAVFLSEMAGKRLGTVVGSAVELLAAIPSVIYGLIGMMVLNPIMFKIERIDTTLLRKKVGMVFQQPNPFPMSIYDNIAYGPRVHGIKDKKKLDKIVEDSLRGAAIWEEVKDRLKKSALSLSGGQQQRICIARALAVEPEILLMDEPTSALDPISTTKIEDLMDELKKKYTVIVVTHNMQQAVRVSDHTAFFLVGEMVEFGETKQIFSYPRDKRTEDYITGRFG